MPNLTDISITATRLSQAQQALDQATGALAEIYPPDGGRIATLDPLIASLTDELTFAELSWAVAKARKNLAEAAVTAAQSAHTAAVGG